MSADVAAYLPTLDDPVWVAWQADQITCIARTNRFGTTGLRYREKLLFTALDRAFNDRLDQWHTWEWSDSIGGVITVDRYAPRDHPHLGTVPLDGLTFEAVAAAEQSLLRQALSDTERTHR
jgi:hypothetical protein